MNTVLWELPEAVDVPHEPLAVTVMGPIPASHIGYCLPHEHAIANHTKLLDSAVDMPMTSTASRAVSIDWLAELRQRPRGCLHNLSLESVDACLAELTSWVGGTTSLSHPHLSSAPLLTCHTPEQSPPVLEEPEKEEKGTEGGDMTARTIVCLTTEGRTTNPSPDPES